MLPALAACSTSDSNPIVDFGEGEGITYRPGQNIPTGPFDPTAWTSDGAWNKQKRALFADLNLNLNLNGAQQPALIAYTSTCPNPSAGVASWTIQTQRSANGGAATYNVRALLVNRKYQVMQRISSDGVVLGMTYSPDYRQSGLSPNELYRLYYVVYNTSGLVYKGHGDVRYSN